MSVSLNDSLQIEGRQTGQQERTPDQTKWMVAVVLVTVLSLVLNSLAFSPTSPFEDNDEIDRRSLPNLGNPPPLTFAIWGIIFSWHFVYCAKQFGANLKDVMAISPAICAAHGSQMLFGLSVWAIPDLSYRLHLATVTITMAFAAFTYLTWSLRHYPFKSSFFWLTFGWTINAAWLVPATYVQWTTLLVLYEAPMNTLQIPCLFVALAVICVFSFVPAFRHPPAYWCVALWTFTMVSLFWTEADGVEESYTEGVRQAYRTICSVVAVLAVPCAAGTFYLKAKLPDDDASSA